MREILFRGKRIDNGEWVEGTLITTTAVRQKTFIVDSACYTSGEVDEEGYVVFDWLNVYEVEPATIGQYTGLCDKTGKRIFEGDIVCTRYANFYTPIFRNGIYMAYNIQDLHLDGTEPSTQFNIVWKEGCEVIGTIHDKETSP